jgi:hypothetical protein
MVSRGVGAGVDLIVERPASNKGGEGAKLEDSKTRRLEDWGTSGFDAHFFLPLSLWDFEFLPPLLLSSSLPKWEGGLDSGAGARCRASDKLRAHVLHAPENQNQDTLDGRPGVVGFMSVNVSRMVTMILAGIVLFYVLSIGPAFRLTLSGPDTRTSMERWSIFEKAYLPVLAIGKFDIGRAVVWGYLDLWRPPPERIAPLPFWATRRDGQMRCARMWRDRVAWPKYEIEMAPCIGSGAALPPLVPHASLWDRGERMKAAKLCGMVAIGIVIVYVLSIGPANGYVLRHPQSWLGAQYPTIYRPLLWLTQQSSVFDQFILRYIDICAPPEMRLPEPPDEDVPRTDESN